MNLLKGCTTQFLSPTWGPHPIATDHQMQTEQDTQLLWSSLDIFNLSTNIHTLDFQSCFFAAKNNVCVT